MAGANGGGRAGPAPLVVQGDGELLLLTGVPGARSVADGLRRFAELVKCPGDVHHYRLTRQSLWNAAAAEIAAARIVDFLHRASGAPPPASVTGDIAETLGRWGRLRLIRQRDGLALQADDPALLSNLAPHLTPGLDPRPAARGPRPTALPVPAAARGLVKDRLARLGWPVLDEAGHARGESLAIGWRPGVALRPYQREAIAAFAGGTGQGKEGGSGLVLLPCGAGKTVIGVGATVALGAATLVLCPNSSAARQWRDAYERFTDLAPERIGEYGPRRAGRGRELRPVTIATYQMLTARARGAGRWARGEGRRAKGEGGTGEVRSTKYEVRWGGEEEGTVETGTFPHLERVMARDWGLLVFDEAHLLPADVFRLAAAVQSRRRLGLTATPVREDGREGDLFALVGPTLYSAPWSRLEAEGWIAPVACVEVRVPASAAPTTGVATRGDPSVREWSHREAASAGTKWPAVRAILRRHRGEPALVIGAYLDQLRDLAVRLGAPLVTGATRAAERERLFDRFRAGAEPVLVLSRVGNAALDLPGALVAIEVSGNFGSRQEEAQRLGRVLRPKGGRTAHFYTLVTEGTVEREHAARRQRFLVEQGYRYRIVAARDLM